MSDGRRRTATAPRKRRARLPLRFALRELRGGLRGFYVFIACIALGVMAIAGVGSFVAQPRRRARARGPRHPRRRLAFSLIQREAKRRRAALPAKPRRRCRSPPPCAPWRASPTASAALVEIKAVDGAYPLYGAVAARSGEPLRRPRWPNATASIGAAADPTLLARLDLKPGARLTIGDATFECAPRSTTEPDKLAGGIGFGPRVLVSEAGAARDRPAAARQPGALALPPAAAGRATQRRRRAAR